MSSAEERTDEHIARTLHDLVSFSGMAERIVDRGKHAYDADEALRLASEAVLHRIGEAVARLPAEFTESHPEVPWRSMKGVRNIVAHEYEQVDYDIIWNALAGRLPREIELVREILSHQSRPAPLRSVRGRTLRGGRKASDKI